MKAVNYLLTCTDSYIYLKIVASLSTLEKRIVFSELDPRQFQLSSNLHLSAAPLSDLFQYLDQIGPSRDSLLVFCAQHTAWQCPSSLCTTCSP